MAGYAFGSDPPYELPVYPDKQTVSESVGMSQGVKERHRFDHDPAAQAAGIVN
jgi:hypothetical protein